MIFQSASESLLRRAGKPCPFRITSGELNSSLGVMKIETTLGDDYPNAQAAIP